MTRNRYQFTPGVSGGEIATIRGEDSEALLTYRGFASIVGIVAALVGAIVAVTGIGAFAFLLHEKRPIPAAAALLLSAGFCVLIAYIIPSISVTIYDGTSPLITIVQQSHSLPSVTFAVAGADGRRLARFRKTLLSRLGRNRWVILAADSNARLGQAIEESLVRALVRKLLGKFARRFESNFRLDIMGREAGVIRRRPDGKGAVDVLNLSADSTTTLDRRVLIALATLILGSEP
jgi:hypothetical protein